jgi:hypothetical protein
VAPDQKQYVEAIEKIMRSGLSRRSAAQKIASFKMQHQPYVTYKEFCFAHNISYRSVTRQIAQGKIKKILTPSGPRIIDYAS